MKIGMYGRNILVYILCSCWVVNLSKIIRIHDVWDICTSLSHRLDDFDSNKIHFEFQTLLSNLKSSHSFSHSSFNTQFSHFYNNITKNIVELTSIWEWKFVDLSPVMWVAIVLDVWQTDIYHTGRGKKFWIEKNPITNLRLKVYKNNKFPSFKFEPLDWVWKYWKGIFSDIL